VDWHSISRRLVRLFSAVSRETKATFRFIDGHNGAIIAIFTVVLAVSTILLWRATEGLRIDTAQSVKAARDSADAAKNANELFGKNLAQTHRPWVAIDVAIAGPLKYDQNRSARVALRFNVRNIGHSPAANVWIEAKTCLDGENDPTAEQKVVCEGFRNRGRGAHALGYMVFPGENLTYDVEIGVEREQIKKTLEKFGATGREWFLPYVVGCVDYQFTFEEGHHQTGFIASLYRTTPDNPNSRKIFFVDEGEIPTERLRLDRVFFGGYAD
jgi:hypothetical protein